MPVCAEAQTAAETVYRLPLCPSCCFLPLQWPLFPLFGSQSLPEDCYRKDQSLDWSLNTRMAKVWYKQTSSVINFCRQEFEVKNSLLSIRESFILKFLGHSFLWDAVLYSLRMSWRQQSLPLSSCTKTLPNLELGLLQPWSRACRWVASNEGIGAEVKSWGPQSQTALKMRARCLSFKWEHVRCEALV